MQQGAAHVKAAAPTLWLLPTLIAILGLVLAGGGIYLAFAGRLAQTTFKLFGNEFSSTSVGLSMAFVGAVVVAVIFRRVMQILYYLAKLPNG
jgi:hypothetical protein